METVMVTGGAGFIGSHLVERLLKEGYSVKIIDNFSTGKEENIADIAKDIEIIKIDIQDKEKVWESLKGVDYVFHDAAMTSVEESIKNPAKCWKVNITGTLHLLNGSVKNNVKRFIFASSAAVYGGSLQLPKKEDMDSVPISPYGNSKVMGELNALKFHQNEGLDCVSLRYFNAYGPRNDPNSPYSGVISSFIGRMINDIQPVIYGDGKQTRDFIYVDDIVDANMLAMKNQKAPGLTFNIATGKQTSLLELVDALNAQFGKNIVPHFREVREGDITHSYADVTKAKEILEFESKTSLKEGLEKTIEWFKNPKK
ncbi:MAG: SDR family oxidoreductase [Candidatus ainarchaeum sp.]|nr:SDR family oxidoreductase [Candidatus ainarchaeum sp.]